MKQNSKIIVMAIIVLIVAIFSLKLVDITGQVTKSESIVKVSPKTLNRGGILTVQIIPGPEGVYNRYAWIYRVGGVYDERMQATSKRICGKSFLCYEPITLTYLIGGTVEKWPVGKYYVRVKEHSEKEEYAKDIFTIVE